MREANAIFIRVNMDDELYEMPIETTAQRKASTSSAELEYDEFCEVVARICREYCQERLESNGSAFFEEFNSWLELMLLPRMKTILRAKKGTS